MVFVPSEISSGRKIDVGGLSFNPIVYEAHINVAQTECGVFRRVFPPVVLTGYCLGKSGNFNRGHKHV